MRSGDGPRQKIQHRDAAEDPLADDGGQRNPAQDAHPLAGFDALRPNRHDDNQQADELSDHAMGVLVLHPVDHRRKLVQRTEGSRPIGNREAGILARDESAGDDQEKRGPGKKDGKAMVCLVIRNSSRRQNKLLSTLSTQSEGSLMGAMLVNQFVKGCGPNQRRAPYPQAALVAILYQTGSWRRLEQNRSCAKAPLPVTVVLAAESYAALRSSRRRIRSCLRFHPSRA